MSDMLDAALSYARRSWPVLPLIEKRKTPIKDTELGFIEGFKDATVDEARLRAVWARYPGANIGLVMGYESGLCVLDPDNKGGKDGAARLKELEATLGVMPKTYTVATKNGKHFYFKYPAEWRDELIRPDYAPGLDIKAKGYVVAVPSVVEGFEYHTINDAPLAELLHAWTKVAIKPELTRADWQRLERPQGSGPSICEEYNLRLTDVLDVPRDAHKTSEGYLIKHPKHGATGNGNMSLNMSRDLWHCFRHDTGGDALTWVAVREGFVECENAGPLDRETIKRCLNVLREGGKVPDEATVRKVETLTKSNGTEETYTVKLRRLDDLANVERFLSRHGDSLKWCEETRRWFVYNDRYWAEVSSDYVKHCARDVPYIIRSESALIGELKNKSDDDRKKMKDNYDAWARTSSLKGRIDAVIELVKADLEISIHEFDKDPLLFNCLSGTFDIRTGEMRNHDPNDLITHHCDYDPGELCERWESFLERVQPSKEICDFLQRAAGYSLTGLTNEEALFFPHGKGATGKSTFETGLLTCAASYGEVSKFATFLADRTESGGSPREDITRLIGKRLAACNEVNKNTRFNSALLKTLVSGESYTARVPFSPQSITFEPIFKLWLFANDQPHIEYDDDAAFRRFYVIPFDVVIPRKEQDKNLKNYFKNDEDAKAGELAWTLQGAVEWYKLSEGGHKDGLRAPPAVVAATRSYQFAMNPLFNFVLDECAVGCENNRPFSIDTSSLWAAYKNGGYDTRKVKSAVSVGKYLKALGFEPFQDNDSGRTRKWRYIRLLEDDEIKELPKCLKVAEHFRTHEHLKGYFTETFPMSTSCKRVSDFCLFICSCVHGLDEMSEGANGVSTGADQTTIARQVKGLLEAWRDANSTGEIQRIERPMLIDAIAARINGEYPQHDQGYLKHFVERLSSEDIEIEALMLGLTR